MVYAEQSFYSPQRLPGHHQCGTHLLWCYWPKWLDFQLWGKRVKCGIWVVFFIKYYKASVFDSSLTQFKIKITECYEMYMEYVAIVLAIIQLCVFIAVLLTVSSSMTVGIPCAKINLPYLKGYQPFRSSFCTFVWSQNHGSKWFHQQNSTILY